MVQKAAAAAGRTPTGYVAEVAISAADETQAKDLRLLCLELMAARIVLNLTREELAAGEEKCEMVVERCAGVVTRVDELMVAAQELLRPRT